MSSPRKLTPEERDFVDSLNKNDQIFYFGLPNFQQLLIMEETTLERRREKLLKLQRTKRRWKLLKNSLVEIATLEKKKARRNLKRSASDTENQIRAKREKYAAIAMAANKMNDYMLAQILAFGGKSAINTSIRDKIKRIKEEDQEFLINLSLTDEKEEYLSQLELILLKVEEAALEKIVEKEIADDEEESDRLYKEIAEELGMDEDDDGAVASRFLLDNNTGKDDYLTDDPPIVNELKRAITIDDDIPVAPVIPRANINGRFTDADLAEAIKAGMEAATSVLAGNPDNKNDRDNAIRAAINAAMASLKSKPTLDPDAIAAGVAAAEKVLRQNLVFRCPTAYPIHCPAGSLLLTSNGNRRGREYPCARTIQECAEQHNTVKNRVARLPGGRRNPASKSCGLSAADNNGYGRRSYYGDHCDEYDIEAIVQRTGVRPTSPINGGR